MGSINRAPVHRFRHHRARAVAGLIVTISTLTLLPVSAWFGLLVLAPLAWTWGMWRAGTDADSTGLRVRALVGQRRLYWSQIDSLYVDPSGQVWASLATGGSLPLTAVTAADLPRLLASTESGSDLASTGPDHVTAATARPLHSH